MRDIYEYMLYVYFSLSVKHTRDAPSHIASPLVSPIGKLHFGLVYDKYVYMFVRGCVLSWRMCVVNSPPNIMCCVLHSLYAY